MKKILVVDFENHYKPSTADSRRMYKLIRHLEKNFKIVSLVNPWLNTVDPDNISYLFDKNRPITEEERTEMSNICIGLYDDDAKENPDFDSEKKFILEMENKFVPLNLMTYFKEVLSKEQPDIVLFKYGFFRRLAELVPTGALIWFDNPISQYHKSVINASCSFYQDIGCSLAQEKRLLAKGRLLTFNHPREAESFISVDNTSTYFFSDQEWLTGSGDSKEPEILFVGNSAPMNTQYLLAFARHCLPLVRQKVPNVKFRIAGTCANDVNTTDPLVIKEPNPIFPDVYKSAKVIVNPVRPGAGFKTKVAEGICSGNPVVTFKEGFDGYVPYGVLNYATNWVDMAEKLVYNLNTTGENSLAYFFWLKFMAKETAYANIDKILL